LVVSTAPDLLKLIGTVYYDPIFPLAQVTTDVETAVKAYLNNLPFNGVFKINSLIDEVQKVTGIVDFKISTIQGKYGAVPYATILRIYTAQAGYLAIDPAFSLATNLTYSASQV
jgi:hypothetical protein